MSRHLNLYLFPTGAMFTVPDNGELFSDLRLVDGDMMFYLTCDGLQPNRRLESSWRFVPDHEGAVDQSGGSEQITRSDGVCRATGESLKSMSHVNGQVVPGVLTVWFREPGSGYDGPPIELDDGPALITVRFGDLYAQRHG